MARTQNQKDRDTQLINLLDGILKELKNITKNIGNSIPNKKGR